MAASPMPHHVVAVIGAATAGSEIARILARRGVIVIVFEQNARPYGKIEDGLPRWHYKQRKDDYEAINRRLDHPNIHFVPLTKLGRDLQFDELRTGWGLSGIVMANGAWRDRPFPVAGADQFAGRGLVYQNSLIYWFNHYPEKAYDGPRYEITPGAIVVGGGLASIDVVKVLQIELTLKALAARGIREEMLRLEREGIEPALQSHGLGWDALGLRPCRLYYRRRVLDMPLSDIPSGAPPTRAEAMRQARAKIVEKAMRKYRFEFHPLRAPTGIIVEGNRMVGVRFSRTEVSDGMVRTLPNTEEEARAELTVSSIGSLPETIPGVARKGEVYRHADAGVGLLMEGTTAVFAAGNVLTGKGNIQDSLQSGTKVGTLVAENYLGLTEGGVPLAEGLRQTAEGQARKIAGVMEAQPMIPPGRVDELLGRVRERQRAVGYDGDYRAWIAKVTPPDLQ